ncbi:MAG TPA: hypothetical protein VF148_12905 [Acidimicrobiia bacterium]
MGSAQHRCRIRAGELAFVRVLAALAGGTSRCGVGRTVGVGAYHGLRAVRLGQSRGWIGLILHVALMAIALVMPITEALTQS